MIRTPSLRLKWPFGQTLALALAMLAAFAGVSEVVARIPFVQSVLPPPSIGTIHAQFAVQLRGLDDLVAQEGPVDCIFLGSSTVSRGIDPEVAIQAYKQHTGRDMRSFAFGVEGLSLASDIAELAEFLIGRYHPQLLVCEASAFALSRDGIARIQELLSSPWIQYHLGSPTVDGWLIEESRAYGYYLLVTGMLRNPVQEEPGTDVTRYGYRPSYDVLEYPSVPPDPQIFWRRYAQWSDPTVSPRQWAGLERLSRFQPQVQVLLLEMPAPPGFTHCFGDGETDHERVTLLIIDRAARLGMHFWATTRLNLIPDNGWKDFHHLNYVGAPVFSRWLGGQLGEAVNQGLLEDPAR